MSSGAVSTEDTVDTVVTQNPTGATALSYMLFSQSIATNDLIYDLILD